LGPYPEEPRQYQATNPVTHESLGSFNSQADAILAADNARQWTNYQNQQQAEAAARAAAPPVDAGWPGPPTRQVSSGTNGSGGSRVGFVAGGAVLLAVVLGAALCVAGRYFAASGPASPAPSATAAPAAVHGFAGHWTSPQWGATYIQVVGGTMKVIYAHDQGRAVGTVNGDTFTGWWTEAPTRKPAQDAGEVRFRLVGAGAGRTVDGSWRYGTDAALRDDWDLTWVGTEIPAAVAAGFGDASLFTPHP
jgi:hypothetical protein